jgi:hypothetical protein
MGREINPFGLRMPEDLKKRIAKSAKTNRRSLNAELIMRLQHSIEQDPVFIPEIREEGDGYKLSDDQSALLKAYNGMSSRRRRALLEFLKGMDLTENK